MRIRTVKPELFLHEQLYDLERETKLPIRVSFIGLFCACDREGRFRWEPRRLGACILPFDTCDFSRVLDALLTRGFLRKYTVDGVAYGVIPSFTKHQHINPKEKPSDYPEPTEFKEVDASLTRDSRVNHASPKEGKGTCNTNTKRKDRGTLEEVIGLCISEGLPPSDGEACFHKWEGNGWTNSGKPIRDWRATIRSWKAARLLPSQKLQQPQRSHATTNPGNSAASPHNNNLNRDAVAGYRQIGQRLSVGVEPDGQGNVAGSNGTTGNAP